MELIKKQTKKELEIYGLAVCSRCNKRKGIDAEQGCFANMGNFTNYYHKWFYREPIKEEMDLLFKK